MMGTPEIRKTGQVFAVNAVESMFALQMHLWLQEKPPAPSPLPIGLPRVMVGSPALLMTKNWKESHLQL